MLFHLPWRRIFTKKKWNLLKSMYEVKDMDFAFGWWNQTFTEKHSFAKVSKKLIKTITFLSNLRKCLTKRYHHLIWGILCSKVLPNKKNPQLKWRHLIWGDTIVEKRVLYFTFKIYQSEGNLLALNDFHIFFHYWCESRKYRNHILFDLLIKYCFLTKI